MAHKKDFNEYEIKNDYVIIYLNKNNDQIVKTYIDTYNLNKIINLNWSWYAAWYENIQGYYASHTEYLGIVNGKPKYKTYLLHKVLIDNKNSMVDHIDHDGLNNRMNNLKIVNNSINLKNRKGINKNNTSGYRNVTWSKAENLWIIQLQIDGKNTRFGKFLDVDEAGKRAKYLRNLYYN